MAKAEKKKEEKQKPKVVCPECGGDNLDVTDTDGGISDGEITENTACLDCGCEFDVKAKVCDVEITVIPDEEPDGS
ncbi:MAG: hypothetical protein PHH54_06305 [Candidatus Nanoarchaeia archaeon]|nr:hypothetical protein [Candidatus Nanoarchaeia archaeon]